MKTSKSLSLKALLFVVPFLPHFLQAQESVSSVGSDHVEVKEVGEPVVRRYLSADSTSVASASNGSDSELGENNLMIMAGTFASSESYEWKGAAKRTAVGRDNFGATYLFEKWHDIDVNFRGEITEYQLDDQKISKLSFLPLFTLPLTETEIPWYVGVGAGAGVFINQAQGYSPISLDYQLVTGLRFPKVIENTGFVVEVGVKNHLLLLSSGQLNALAVDVGATFTF